MPIHRIALYLALCSFACGPANSGDDSSPSTSDSTPFTSDVADTPDTLPTGELPTTTDEPGTSTGDADMTTDIDEPSMDVLCLDDTGSIPDAFVGATYAFELVVTGGAAPYTWQPADLPDGLALTVDPDDSSRAHLTGTPTTAGEFAVDVVVTDANATEVSTSCGALLVHAPVEVDHAALQANGGCLPVGDGDLDSLADLLGHGILAGDMDTTTTCALLAARGHGSGDFDADTSTPDTAPPGITLADDTCTVGGAISPTLRLGTYAFLVTYTQSTSASTAEAHVPYCAAQQVALPGAYTVTREDAGDLATFAPGIQQLGPGEPVQYGTAAPDPKVIVDLGGPCGGNACFYAFVFRYNALSPEASVSANPNAKFPANGFEGFSHGIRVQDSNPDLLDRFAGRAWITNVEFDYCIADNASDCGNDEEDPSKRAEKVRANGDGSYYFSLVLLPSE